MLDHAYNAARAALTAMRAGNDSTDNTAFDAYAEALEGFALGGDSSVDLDGLAEHYAELYHAIDVPIPEGGLRVHLATGPLDAGRIAAGIEPTTEDHPSTDGVGLGYDLGWVGAYALYLDLTMGDSTVLDPEDLATKGLNAYRAICFAGVWDSTLGEEDVVVVPRPSVVHRDEDGELHHESEPAISWGTEGCYAWHGIIVPQRYWRTPEAVSPEEWRGTNTEVRRAAIEHWGWDAYLRHLGAEVVDEWKDPITGLHYELHDPRDGEYRLLRKQSPPLHDGSQPWYVEPVPVDCQTARGARRWQVPEVDGTVLSAEEAERRADELSYPGGEA